METTIKSTKICSSCKLQKETTLFGKSKRNKDGLRYECKECRNKSFKEHYRYNKETILKSRIKTQFIQVYKKVCRKCKVEKSIDSFYTNGALPDGHMNSCKECQLEKAKIFRKNNKEHCAQRAKIWRTKRGIWYGWANNGIQKHKERGYTINFNVLELEEKAKKSDVCYLCGIKLNWDSNKKTCVPTSPTLENINCKQGLNIEDIEIACYLCNTSKGPRTYNEFINYCEFIYLNHSSNKQKLRVISND